MEFNSFIDIDKYCGKDFDFHYNVKIPSDIVSLFPRFYRYIIDFWSKYYSHKLSEVATFRQQCLWFHKSIDIDNLEQALIA